MASVTEKQGKQEYSFQAEIKQLLHLLSHSLYQSREIAVRELVSNASDALDKMRYIALTDESRRETGALEIVVEGRKEERQLVIRDNGIGMTHDELVENLGTIAHSGSLDFLKGLAVQQQTPGKTDLSLIGQFGVGFYSAFMIADEVRVRTRSFKDERGGWEWASDGTGTFTVTAAEGQGFERGTEVVLHLKEDAQDLVEDWRIKGVLRKYSSFVPHPIKVGGQVVNDQKPIWVEPRSQVTEEQYTRFYQHLTHHTDETPLWHLHLAADSPIQFRAILYCPPSNVEKLGLGRTEHGLNLCAKRIFVQHDCRDLVPDYFRFLYGLVDSEDLPLNVSRETLQDNTVIRRIRNTLVKGALDRLHSLAEETPEAYNKFYQQFSMFLKEGVATDGTNRERLAKLLRFNSTHHQGEATTSLDEYVKRMPADQKRIYYLGGPDLSAIKNSPNLEIFRRRSLEVLFLTEPIDEFVMSALHTFDGKPLTSIDSDDLELPGTEVETSAEEKEKAKEEGTASGFGRVLELFRKALGDRVQEVRESKRLTDSPCCLVNAEGGMSTQMQRLLRMTNREIPETKRIFEVNPSAPLVKRLAQISGNRDHDGFIEQCGLQLYSNALLLEGAVTEPEGVVARVQRFMEEAAEKRSPLVLR
jgi:molecular chaperone HtpG